MLSSSQKRIQIRSLKLHRKGKTTLCGNVINRHPLSLISSKTCFKVMWEPAMKSPLMSVALRWKLRRSCQRWERCILYFKFRGFTALVNTRETSFHTPPFGLLYALFMSAYTILFVYLYWSLPVTSEPPPIRSLACPQTDPFYKQTYAPTALLTE